MTEQQAKRHLRQMLRSLTPGSVLHLLSEVFAEQASKSRRTGDRRSEKQANEVSAALFVVGLGVDAAFPRSQQGRT